MKTYLIHSGNIWSWDGFSNEGKLYSANWGLFEFNSRGHLVKLSFLYEDTGCGFQEIDGNLFDYYREQYSWQDLLQQHFVMLPIQQDVNIRFIEYLLIS